MFPDFLYAVFIVLGAAGVCVCVAAMLEFVIVFLYHRFPSVRRFFDRIQFDDEYGEEPEEEEDCDNEALSF